MKARYTKVSGNVENIASSLEQYQVQLLKDVAMFNRLYNQNSRLFPSVDAVHHCGRGKAGAGAATVS